MSISIARLAIHLTTETAGMVTGFSKAKGLASGFAGSMKGMGGGLVGAAMFNPWVAVGTALAGVFGAIAYKGIAFNSMMEQARASLTGFTGSAGAANAVLSDLFQFAAVTPFEMPEVVAAAKTMMAMGTETEDVMAQMRILGQVAAGIGQPLGELAQVFGQVMQAGRLTGNELRQFNERGIPLLAQLSQNLGVTKADIRKMVEEGKIGSADVVKAFADMATGSGIFAGQMDKQADTLAGQWATFKDNMNALAGDLMAGLGTTLKEILQIANQTIEWIRGTKRETKEEAESSIKAYTEKTAAIAKAAEAAKAEKDAAEAAAKAAKDRMDELKKRADSLTESLRTPAEVWRDSMNELNELMNEGLLSWDTYSRAIEQATQKLEEQTATKKNLDAAYRDNPALVRGSQGALSAINQQRSDMTEMKKQTALAQQASKQREQLIAAVKDKKEINVREVRL